MSVLSAPGDLVPVDDKENTDNPKQASVTKSEYQYGSPHSKQKFSEKGKAFWKDVRNKNRESAFRKLKKKFDHIKKLCEGPEPNLEALEAERNKLDSLKEELNEAHHAYEELLDTLVEKEESYRWFDVRDREFLEKRMKICEYIQSLERSSYGSEKSVTSGHTSKTKSRKSDMSCKSSQYSLSLAKADASAKVAKAKIEMEFLEKETELKRLQLEKQYALAKAEENAFKEVLDEQLELNSQVEENVKIENTDAIPKTNPQVTTGSVKQEVKADSTPFIPISIARDNNSSRKGQPATPSHDQTSSINLALNQLVDLQVRQTELNSQLIKQQRSFHLPVKEPPIFSGNPFEYPAFITAFDAIITANVPADRDRLFFLEKFTSGKANDSVKGFLAAGSETAYKEARKLLDQRYGNPVIIAESFKSSLRNWRQISDGDSKELQDFSDFLIRCQEAMKTMKSTTELDSSQVLLSLSAKLPSYSGVKWCRFAHEEQMKRECPIRFKDFVRFVKLEAELANDPIFSPDALKRERKKGSGEQRDRSSKPRRQNYGSNTGQSFASSVTPIKSRQPNQTASPSTQLSPCSICMGNHPVAKCIKLSTASLDEKYDIVRSKRLCFRCLKPGHLSRDCQSRSNCRDCNKRHHTLLHGVNPTNQTGQIQSYYSQGRIQEAQNRHPVSVTATANASSVSLTSHGELTAITSSKIVPVFVSHRDYPGKEVKVYALLDDASDTTFVTNQVKEELGVPGVETNLSLSTMHGRRVISVSRIDGLTVERPDRRAKIDLPRAYTKEKIPSRRNQIPTPAIAERWSHLQRIKEKIPELDTKIDIGLLIGCNCPKAIKPKEIITGKSEEPYAIRTLLGWCIVGPTNFSNTLDKTDPSDESSCNRILAQEVNDEGGKLEFVINQRTKELINPLAVTQMFELDFSENRNARTQGLSKEDRRFLNLAETGIHRCDDGHYELPLPLKTSFKGLLNNRRDAVRRTFYLKRRFTLPNNQEFTEEYMNFMKKMIDNGYAEKVPKETNAKPGMTFYINHHGTRHPKKKKLRIVFNCSQEFNGESLNKHLIQGPLLTNDLTGVLLRFRQERIALTCDIEGMFHQIRVNPEHRDLLRFLWWEGNDLSKDPTDYRMTVHLFGATSSPSCANFALKKTADDYEEEFGAQAANFIRHNFYVDDGLKSVPTEEEALNLVKNVKKMCSKGGFNLHKFLSNSKEVIKGIQQSDRADGVKEVDLDLDSLPLERTLGVHWCVESDCFQFSIVLQDKPCTRRGILSTVSSVFDPLGFVAPLMLQGKSILQELCRQDLEWDDPIPSETKAKWERWRTELLKLQRISIPRCYKPEGFGHVTKTELHNFSDASTLGYGQCSYLRLVDENGQVHCAFVMGKSRVAPLKPVTVPRLELTAAVCSVRISQQIQKELEYNIDEVYYWTDSKVVLGYINNESRRFHVFVSNRIQEVHDHTNSSQWRYVESKENPADEASRGMKAQELQQSRWILGPAFLWNKEDKWLAANCRGSTFDVAHDDPEVKKCVVMATMTSPVNDIEERIGNFSEWHRAKRAVALCTRYIKKLKDRVSKKATQETQVTVEDLKKASTVMIRAAQTRAFQEEKIELSKKTHLKTNSAISKLDPFVDSNGLLRVGGRLKYANLNDDVKHPIILPKNSHVTSLLIRDFHERTLHQGKGITLNEIRSNGFWVIGGSSAVSNAIVSCVKCRKLRGPVVEQKMSDLPEDRVEASPPFSYCAVDYFGPFMIKEGRKELKRYGVLFTCMSSRAVHVETASSLETDSFIHALRRFLCRRGPVRQLRSDQGTNFIGARRELKEALEEMNHDRIRSELLKQECDWINFKMNTPGASHMGGVWERQIRSVRAVLSSLLSSNPTRLDDESLRTFMCEAESIINSRPLTVDQLTDPDSPEPLTPNHLLTMKSKILLPPPGNFQPADAYVRKRWRRVQYLTNEFWSRWRKEFLLSLQERQKWTRPRRNLHVDDIVIVKDVNTPRNAWQLARVSAVYPSDDGQVRKVQVALADSCLDSKGRRTGPMRYLERPIQKLVLLVPTDNKD